MSEEISVVETSLSPSAIGLQGDTPKESNLLREIVETALLTAIIFLVVNMIIGRFRIESVSMLPNLVEGEYVIVDKVSYSLHAPERGDIVVIKRVGAPDLIKRVIGLPGETIEVHGGQTFINGVALNEPYVAHPPTYDLPATTVEPDRVYVLGDNRSNSQDSHIFGSISKEDLVGRAWIIYWPPPNWQIVPHYTYAVAAAQ